MGVDGKKQRVTSCERCSKNKDTYKLQNVVDLENISHVTYQIDKKMEAANNIPDDFTHQNWNEAAIISADFIPELDLQKVSCPKCRKILEESELIINKQDVEEICLHCKLRAKTRKPSIHYLGTTEKFVVTSQAGKEDLKDRFKVWLSKMKHLLKDITSKDLTTRKIRKRAYSETDIDIFEDSTLINNKRNVYKDLEKLDISIPLLAKTTDMSHMQCQKSVIPIESHEYYKQQPKKDSMSHSSVGKGAYYTLQDGKFSDQTKPMDKTQGLYGFNLPNIAENVKDIDKIVENKQYLLGNRDSSPQFQTVDLVPEMYNSDETNVVNKITKPDKIVFSPDDRYHQTSLVKSSRDHGKEIEDCLPKVNLPLERGGHIHNNKSPLLKVQIDRESECYLNNIEIPNILKTKCVKSAIKITKVHSEEDVRATEPRTKSDKEEFHFIFPEIYKEEKLKLNNNISSTELIKDTQDILQARAQKEKKRVQEEYERIRKEKNNIAREKKTKEEKRKLKGAKIKAYMEEMKQFNEATESIKQEPQQSEKESPVIKDHRKRIGKVSSNTSDTTSYSKKTDSYKKFKQTKDPKINIETRKSKREMEDKALKQELVPKEKKEQEQLMKEKYASVQKDKMSKSKDNYLDKNARIAREADEKSKLKNNRKSEKEKSKETSKGSDEKAKDKPKTDYLKDVSTKLGPEESKLKDNRKSEKETSKASDDKTKDKAKTDNLKDVSSRPGREEDKLKDKNEKKAETKGKDKMPVEIKKLDEITEKPEKPLEQANKLIDEKNKKEEAERKAREAAENKILEAEILLMKKNKEAQKKSAKEQSSQLGDLKSSKKVMASNAEQELKIKDIKVRRPSADDLILRLVKLKEYDPDKLTKGAGFDLLKEHLHHKNGVMTCPLCISSDIELDFEDKFRRVSEGIEDIIIGPKIFKFKPSYVSKKEEKTIVPILFESVFTDKRINHKNIKEAQHTSQAQTESIETKTPLATKLGKTVEQEPAKGIIRYALSDRTFIDKGWTMLPTEKVVRKMNVYRMRPAHPEFDWFEHNKNKKLMLYETGEKLAEFDDNGRGRWYYRNGNLALDYYDAEETNAQQRFVIYSSGEPDERGRTHPITILATFDYLGNGVVFDHGGKIRLKYNQTEGVVLDRNIGPVSHWKWHTLNDPPVLQQVMIDTQMAHKDPDIFKMGGPGEDKPRPDNEEMLAIEFDNFIKEKSKKLSQSFKPFQIKMKALKINEHFSLKVLDQATVYLIFRDGSANLKLNIGMILDHKEIVDTDIADVGDVSNSLERFPARTDSLARLQRSVAYAQRFERSRTERERRLRPPEPCNSVDELTAAVSKPLRLPFHTVPSSSTTTRQELICKCSRKPSFRNLYYDTRFV